MLRAPSNEALHQRVSGTKPGRSALRPRAIRAPDGWAPISAPNLRAEPSWTEMRRPHALFKTATTRGASGCLAGRRVGRVNPLPRETDASRHVKQRAWVERARPRDSALELASQQVGAPSTL